jgi:DNA invertase Pin-like site-specific DNA recombinase
MVAHPAAVIPHREDGVRLADGERNRHGDLYLYRQGPDTRTPSGRAVFGTLGVFADFERSMISERVKSGLERAKASGKKLGRPS